MTSETDPHGKARTYSYDAASDLTKVTDRNGRVTEFVYDNLYRQTQEVWKDASNNTVNTIASMYDAASQLTSIVDSFSEYAYSYDNLGRVTEVDNAGTPGVPNVVLTSAYDANGNRTELAATIAGTADFTNTYQYDALNRMTRITQTDGSPTAGLPIAEKRVDLAYNAAGQFETITRYADLAGTDVVATSSYSYDGMGRLTDLTHTKGANTLADYSYTFDAASRITSVTSVDGTSTYSYDATSQLTAADYSYQTDESYSYNLTGGRTDSDNDHGTGNRLLSDGTYSYQYDDEGNRTRKTTIATGDYVEYKWDHRNRLTGVEFRTSADVLTKQVEFKYDTFDRLISKRVDDDGNGTFDRAQKFVYDGFDLALVYDGAGSLTNRFLYGPALDQVFADEDALGEVLWGLTDHQGTVRDLVQYDAATDATSVVNHVEYDSFGNITAQTNAAEQPLFAFTGRYWDPDVQLQWNWQRWYEPRTGLWLSPDPIGFASGDTNLYRYVRNSPTNAVDPYGLDDIQVNVRQGWSPAAGAYYNAYIAYYENQQMGNPPADPFGASLWNDVTLIVKYPGQAAMGYLRGYYVDGGAMVANAFTLGQIDALNDYVNDAVETNGGMYTVAYYSSWVGAGATYSALGLAAAEWVGMTQLGSSALGSEFIAQAQLEWMYLTTFGSPFAYGMYGRNPPTPPPTPTQGGQLITTPPNVSYVTSAPLYPSPPNRLGPIPPWLRPPGLPPGPLPPPTPTPPPPPGWQPPPGGGDGGNALPPGWNPPWPPPMN